MGQSPHQPLPDHLWDEDEALYRAELAQIAGRKEGIHRQALHAEIPHWDEDHLRFSADLHSRAVGHDLHRRAIDPPPGTRI